MPILNSPLGGPIIMSRISYAKLWHIMFWVGRNFVKKMFPLLHMKWISIDFRAMHSLTLW